jgi:hypothetical protein
MYSPKARYLRLTRDSGANYWPVGKPGSNLQRFERATWPELARICREVPEAGVHFQESRIYGRTKDAGTATGEWFAELCKEDAWFKDVAPNVSSIFIDHKRYIFANSRHIDEQPGVRISAPNLDGSILYYVLLLALMRLPVSHPPQV